MLSRDNYLKKCDDVVAKNKRLIDGMVRLTEAEMDRPESAP